MHKSLFRGFFSLFQLVLFALTICLWGLSAFGAAVTIYFEVLLIGAWVFVTLRWWKEVLLLKAVQG
jgi:hypothetical protein